MANNINKAFITGNLTRDAELRRTQGGADIMKLGVAVNGRRKNQDGEWEDSKSFIDCVMFGRRAASVAQYLPKGTKVAIEGHLETSSWETNDGQHRSKTELVIDELEFMSRRDSISAPVAAAPVAAAPESPVGDVYDEEIPF